MQSIVLTKDLASAVRPRAGRVLLMVPRKPEAAVSSPFRPGAFMAERPLVYAPDSARDHAVTDTHQRARVLKVGYGPFYEEGVQYAGVGPEDFQPGDTVVFRPLLMELNAPYILTDVRRVDAKIVR